jgi:hypothetical protein
MVEDWRRDYNHRRPHSALGMTTPAGFARTWREDRENGGPMTFSDGAQGRRSPQDAPVRGRDGQDEADHGPSASQPALALALRSPSGLAPREGDLNTMQPPSDQRLSLQLDR